MHNRNALQWITLLCAVGIVNIAEGEPNRFALLVGCSEYVDKEIAPLPGAANDVEQFRKLLTKGFGFDDIDTLVGWPEDEQRRPTAANIVSAMERLVARAKSGSQVVIVLSGHGSRFPLPESQTDLLDARNPEPDGFDEAFLAADYHLAENMILDNQVGQWLDQLKSNGAHVWIVFDSCFSGTMMRGGKEKPRRVAPQVLGIPPAVLAAARRRAAESVPRTRGLRKPIHDGLEGLSASTKADGSVVAFYAAQDFETAPEVPRPPDADPTPENTHGLLSFHLQALLGQAADNMNYRDLGRILIGRYRSERGSRSPTPCFAGDLDQKVLGFEKWSEPNPLVLEVDYERVAAGQLAGLTTGTVLSVHPPDDKDGKVLLGHIRLTAVSATASAVEIVDGKESIEQFPDLARCRVVSQDLGDARVKLAVAVPDDSPWKEAGRQVEAALTKRIAQKVATVKLVDEPLDAHWLLTPPQTPADANADAAGSKPSWVLSDNRQSSADRRVEVQLPFESVDRLAVRVTDDLQKVFTWGNIWQIANAYGKGSPKSLPQSVELEVAQLSGPNDRSRGIPLTSSQVQVGDCYVVRAVNHSSAPYWYTVLFLNGRYGIEYVTSGALAPRREQGVDREDRAFEREVERISIASDAFGSEGYVVIAVSQRQHKSEPNYRFLAQSVLGKPGSRAAVDGSRLTTPFEKLLLNAVHGSSRVRSGVSPDDPRLDAWSWTPVATDSNASGDP